MILDRVLETFIVPIDKLVANDYNPNRMPDEEMNLLAQCIKKYGFLFPIITVGIDDGLYRIVDGYHRYETLKRMGKPDVAIIDLQIDYDDAIQLTVLMNRIKGMHQVEKMSDLIKSLEDSGLKDSEICDNLGMEVEEFVRLKQQLGIAHAFKDHEYTKSWEEGDV